MLLHRRLGPFLTTLQLSSLLIRHFSIYPFQAAEATPRPTKYLPAAPHPKCRSEQDELSFLLQHHPFFELIQSSSRVGLHAIKDTVLFLEGECYWFR